MEPNRPPAVPAGEAPPASAGPEDAPVRAELKDRALDVAAEGICIADARRPGRPLVYVNQGFERLTGYAATEALGKNCRFLQGPGTDPAAVEAIREALALSRPCVVEILNYRRDGAPFWNRLSLTPVRDGSGEVTHFIGLQADVTTRRTAEESLRRSKEALERDLRLAARVQRALFPPPEVEMGSLRVAHAFHPCDDLAGDGLGVVPLPGHRAGIYLLDVSGHGVAAALLSFTLNHVLSATVEGALLAGPTAGRPAVVPPAEVAGRLNRQFPMDRSRQYFTLVYGVLDTRSGALDYVVAGHPPPVLLPRRGRPALLPGGDVPVGMIDGATFTGQRLALRPGDRLYLYTDGVFEARNAAGEDFGAERLLAAIERHRDLPLRAGLEAVVASVREWAGGGVGDDVSLLAVEREARAARP